MRHRAPWPAELCAGSILMCYVHTNDALSSMFPLVHVRLQQHPIFLSILSISDSDVYSISTAKSPRDLRTSGPGLLLQILAWTYLLMNSQSLSWDLSVRVSAL